MDATNCRVGIIGAGSTGVYLASLLVRQGYQVDLFEKAARPRTDGCGILLVTSGMNALAQGNPQLCQQLIKAGRPAQRFEFRNLKGGVVNTETVTLQPDELPSMLIHRKAILEALLADLTDLPSHNIGFHFNYQFESLSQTDDGVTVHFTNGQQWQGDVLVGCDGIFSQVRRFVAPEAKTCYLGDLVWRGIVADEQFCADGDFILYVRGRGIYSNFFDIGGGYTHWGFFIERVQDETEIGRPRPNNKTIPAQELAKLPSEARFVIESTPTNQIVTNFSYDLDPLPILHQGRVVLLGDAAHAKSPSRARGMTSGFEDALALVNYLNDSQSVATALAGFEAERLPIVHEYQRSSREISRKTGRKKQKTAA
ncbi:MAG: NAD(P)-binding protein [Cyanothece sp. SIO2G6]|nr:NAD(P)-binding protein [Cyanothece sp. SIO2G6]